MNKLTVSSYRNIVLFTALLLAGFVVVEGRLFYLQVLRHGDLGDETDRYNRYRRILEAWRGEIRSRDGKILAISQPCRTVYANLTVCSNRLELCARILAWSLHLNPVAVQNRMRAAMTVSSNETAKQALMIKRGVSDQEWSTLTNILAHETFAYNTNRAARIEKEWLQKLRHRSVFAAEEQFRVYTPSALGLGHLLGKMRLRDDGQGWEGAAGLESFYNAQLSGVPGLWVSHKDASGKELPYLREQYVPPIAGNHVVLTIDSRLQEICEKALLKACERHCPSNATVMMLHPKTGEILAWVEWPFRDFNHAAKSTSFRIHAIEIPFEPGSIFKMITLAAALNERITDLAQTISGEQGYFRYFEAVLHDRKPYGMLSVREAMAHSVNIIFAKLGLALGPERFSRNITNFGFGAVSGVSLYGEATGDVKTKVNWSNYTKTRVPIGQGIQVTEIQMLMAAGAIGNAGQLMRPLLATSMLTPQGRVVPLGQPTFVRQVIAPQTAQIVREGMIGVCSSQGTASAAALQTHTVCGKTGTAQIANGTGYLPDAYYASFIGLVPAKEPQLCILVTLNCPKRAHTGGLVAAPVFHEIAQQAVACLNIPSDKPGPMAHGLRLTQRAAPSSKQPPVL